VGQLAGALYRQTHDARSVGGVMSGVANSARIRSLIPGFFRILERSRELPRSQRCNARASPRAPAFGAAVRYKLPSHTASRQNRPDKATTESNRS
jgi:hypothetical protein